MVEGNRHSLEGNGRVQVPLSMEVLSRLDNAGLGAPYKGLELQHCIPQTAEELEATETRAVAALNLLNDPYFGEHIAPAIIQASAEMLAEGKLTEDQYLDIDTAANKKIHGSDWSPGELREVYTRFGTNGNGHATEEITI